MKRSVVGIAFAACAVGLLAVGAPALAHGDRGVGDKKFTVGWATEPPIAGQPNAVQLFLEHDGKPALGAENTIKVTVGVGGKTSDPLKLRTVFDSPGEYRADLIPTVVGGYTFHFTGTLEGEKVDQSFTAPKDGFDEVEGTSDLAFPKAAPTTTELAERVVSMQNDLDDAKASVGLPRVLAIVALALAVVALGAGARRSRSAA
jgi:hypothetical protein